jgi:streptogramin lyase
MRTGPALLSTGVALFFLLVVIAGASGLELEEADLPGTVYEINPGTAGDIYASNNSASEVWRIDASGAYTVYEGIGSATDAKLDSAGDIWYTDSGLSFGRIDVSSEIRTTWTLSGAQNLGGLAFDDAGGVWLTQWFGQDIYHFDPSATVVCTYSVGAPSEYVRYDQGELWLASWGRDRVYRFDTATGAATWWPIMGDNPYPMGLELGDDGNLWWADAGLGVLARLQPDLDLMTSYSLPVGTEPQMIDIRPEGVWYTEYTRDGAGTFGVLRPDTATGVTTELTRSAPAVVTPDCLDTGLGGGIQASVTTRTGDLAWAADSLAPVVDGGGWTVYQVPSGPRQAGPYGIASSGDYLWIGDQGRQKLLRIVRGGYSIYLPVVLRNS